jgi:hypothetical protein
MEAFGLLANYSCSYWSTLLLNSMHQASVWSIHSYFHPLYAVTGISAISVYLNWGCLSKTGPGHSSRGVIKLNLPDMHQQWFELEPSVRFSVLFFRNPQMFRPERSYTFNCHIKRETTMIIPGKMSQKLGNATFLFSHCTVWSKSLCAPDDYSTKNTQKYFKQFQSLIMIT